MLLQNGFGIEEPFIANDFQAIYRCILFTTCQQIAENTVKFKPIAESKIGTIKGNSETLQNIINLLNNEQFQFGPEENLQSIIWKKAIANCVFNSICPLLDVDNGIFVRDEAAIELAKKVIAECVNIANNVGIEIKEYDVKESVIIISKMADGQLISTLQDINNKRRTEIDTLNFVIVSTAQKLGKLNEVPITKLLGELTKKKADLNMI